MRTFLIVNFFLTTILSAIAQLDPHGTNNVFTENPISLERVAAIEKLWAERPDRFYQETAKMVGSMTKTPLNASEQQILLILWTNAVGKVLPTEDSRALACLSPKKDALFNFFALPEFHSDKARWRQLSCFIGELKMRITPDYRNKAVMNYAAPGDSLEEIKRYKKENEKIALSDELQILAGEIAVSLAYICAV
jgi:hypothetical protein